MIGNDIVDLQKAALESNWNRPRYLTKIFSEQELYIINASTHKDRIIWQLWSMKEAAYKAYVQITHHQFYNPKKAICSLKNSKTGSVTILNYTFNTKTILKKEFVYTIASSTNFNNINSKFFKQKNIALNEQSKHIKKLLIEDFQANTENTGKIVIKKTRKNIPKLYVGQVKLNNSVSITHHGKFSAYCYTE